jgi:hypothetical protein
MQQRCGLAVKTNLLQQRHCNHQACIPSLVPAQAIITISTQGNAPLRDWTKDLPQHLAAAAAHNTTGENHHTSGWPNGWCWCC